MVLSRRGVLIAERGMTQQSQRYVHSYYMAYVLIFSIGYVKGVVIRPFGRDSRVQVVVELKACSRPQVIYYVHVARCYGR